MDVPRRRAVPRANRYFLPGQIWHITHRCHEKAFLLKFSKDRRRYLAWMFEAKKRFGLCVLGYTITSNHVHLLVKDTEEREGAIPRSMQLIAGRTAQEFNLRKARQGAFWEDRYHATAVETGEHLQRCMVYIDLNMVRAGVVRHPEQWREGGYREIQNPPQRYALLDLAAVSAACGFECIAAFQRAHRQWVAAALALDPGRRDERWSESIAVGSEAFIARVRRALGSKASARHVTLSGWGCELREDRAAYRRDSGREKDLLSSKIGRFSEETHRNAMR
jgi:putative transposase